MQTFIRNGGGWAGLHAASASERDWQWYEGLVGTIFDYHPDFSSTGGTFPGRVKVLDRAHPSTRNLPELWEQSEEWYNWRTNPTGNVHTLAQIKVRDGINGLDEGVDHAYSWCQRYDGGRSWFTAGGHASSQFSSPTFLEHLRYGIEWAAGAVAGDCSATKTSNFERVGLVTENLADPFELAVGPDRKVYYIQRTGALKVVNSDTLQVTTLLDFAYTSAMTDQSDGLLGMTLDRNFASNGWIYLLWSDKTLKQLNLSRFTVANNSVALSSEKRLLAIPTYRGEGRANSHMGGSLAMDAAGRLYAAIGDNTDPFASSGYTPVDERAGRAAWDAQGTAGNTNDLRGKILRITPQADGTYTVPERQPLPGRHREDPAGDLRDGHAQPVPDHHRSADQRGAGGRLRSGRPRRRPQPRPGGDCRVQPDHQRRQLRLAVLRRQQHPVQRLQLRHQHLGGEVQLRRTREQLAQQHRPDHPAGGEVRAGLVRVLRLHPVPRAGHRRWRADERPGLRLRPGQHPHARSSPSTSRASGSPMS